MTARNEIGDLMAKRKTNFEIVKQADIAPLLANSEQRRILSVTYDPSLAHTREMLFTGAGFEVSTFLDVAKAISACKSEAFDLVVLGHSIPFLERRALVREAHESCAAPVLALIRRGEPRLPEADYFFDPLENPALLLEMVINIFHAGDAAKRKPESREG